MIVDRRPGDVAVCYADPSSAKNEIGWIDKKRNPKRCVGILGDCRRRIRLGMIVNIRMV